MKKFVVFTMAIILMGWNIGSVSAEDAVFDNLNVTNELKVGTNSLFIGPGHHIYTDTGDLYLQAYDINNGNVGIGTINPDSKLHVEKAMSTSGQAVHVNFSNAAASVGTKGIKVESTEVTGKKGSQIAIDTVTSMNYNHDGSASGLLSYVSGWSAQGRIVGVRGKCEVNNLSNLNSSYTSWGVGGQFITAPDNGTTLNLGTGNHWIAGVYSEVGGVIDGDPGSGAVAAVVGIDNNTGNAGSFAGYFKGRLLVKGSTDNDLSDFVNEQPDVDSASSVIWAAYGYGSSQANNPMLIQATGSDGGDKFVVRNNGNVGINTTNPQYTLDVNGDIHYTGSLVSSDKRWKKNIEPLENSLERVAKLQGVNYEWKTDEYPDKGFSEDKQIGFIAQEVEPVFPEIVKADDEGYKSVSYEKVVPALVEAIKELKAQNEALKARIEVLENK
ncbi:MAG: tail fiber domain-containing protein [Desulfobacterales bacterium]|nr:tail fiber domain-containing protein [Desulfobacterales bacterium]